MNTGSSTIDFAIAWTWEHDADFVRLLFERAARAGLRTLSVRRENIASVTADVVSGHLSFATYLDRASDEDESFLPLAGHILQRYRSGDGNGARPLNPQDLLSRAADKATMHLEFLSAGIHVPYTIIISPFNLKREVELTLTELEQLGRPFIIKPANTTGGGVGVVLGAETLRHVLDARQAHKNDKYLLQEAIHPVQWGGKRAWFRCFYICGDVIVCWWDDQTHRYAEVTDEDLATFGLAGLEEITRRIHGVCSLDFFSTEVAFTPAGDAISVDYVNELCDMRLQSSAPDGVPDRVVERICDRIIRWVAAGDGGATNLSKLRPHEASST